MELGGLHHVTAVTSDAQSNLDFYTRVLGMRLVKKTVNQDDVSAYHLFYGDVVGNPGTEMTFFDWPAIGANRPGAGAVSTTAFRVCNRSAIEWWSGYFDRLGVSHGEVTDRSGRAALSFADPEGQSLELIEDGDTGQSGVAPGVPWENGSVPTDHAIRGLAAVTLTVSNLAPTARVLTDVMGFRLAGEQTTANGTGAVFAVGPGGGGAEVVVEERSDPAGSGSLGAGGVHHVAFRVPNFEEHQSWQTLVADAGLRPTKVIDRFYFRSIYFREPGGVLFELATDGPGFTADEDAKHLGERLSLPPFLENRRPQIEANLKPLGPVRV